MILINLDYQNRTSIYEQIVLEIERYVALGILKEGEQMPSIRELASSLGINPNTVKKSYDILENKKIITTISTKGTFISNKTDEVIENKTNEIIDNIKDSIKLLEQLGMKKDDIIKRLK